ncbi:predicted protein [Chaetoceros tenuissimus]|uniref:Uncharacterized protein n=1 Tax=Chaetoceros tenuissimus TaxID=426638 RepID=A0AAD3GZQ0_9STRA|nr:predicted protein [Chaetoceros tenuissimus]
MNSHQTIPATPLAESSTSIESKVLDEPQSVEPQEILGKTVSTPNEAQKIKLGNDKDLLLTIATSSENDLSKEIEGLALGSKTEEDTESDSSNSTVDLTGPSYACIDFKQGFIKDDWAKGCVKNRINSFSLDASLKRIKEQRLKSL